jgi:hypothetical protein
MSQLRVNTITDTGGTGSTYAPGHVVQVVQAVKTDPFTSTAVTPTTITGLTATITPRSATSRILVMFDTKVTSDPALISAVQLRLARGSTGIYIGDSAGSRVSGSFGGAVQSLTTVMEQVTGIFLDSPATTSATTYSLQIFAPQNQLVYVNRTRDDSDNAARTRAASSITLMEIAQ